MELRKSSVNVVPGSSSRKDRTQRKQLLPDSLEVEKPFLNLKNYCTRCIGRAYYGSVPISGNYSRGNAIKFVHFLLGERNWLIEETQCPVCHGLTSDLDRYAEKIYGDLKDYQFNSFLVGCILPEQIEDAESAMFKSLGMQGESIKKEFNRETGKMLSTRFGREPMFDDPDIIITVDLRYDQFSYYIRPVLIYGKYRKLQRGIPQTRWIHKGSEEKSIEEHIGEPAMEIFQGKNFYLHGSGREDVDVRMLGNGREFVIEVESPKIRNSTLEGLESRVNSTGKVEILDLEFCDRKKVEEIKSSKHIKTYRATVTSKTVIDRTKLAESIAFLSGKIIYQRTPLRVASRRSDLIRQRKVVEASLVSTSGSEAIIELTAESGTYVKELVSGDSGRTDPSLSTLYGSPLSISELDVIRIQRGDE